MRNVPKLRFKEFTDEWEEKKLGEISDVSKLAGFEFTNYVIYENTGEIIALRGLNIKNNKLELNDVKYIDKSDFSKLERSKLYKNDLMFTYVGTIGEVALIPEEDKFYLAPNVCRIRSTDKINAKYLLFVFNSNVIKNEIYKYLTTTSQPALSMENIRKFLIKLPCFNEQEKIADFLSSIDKKISITEEKLNLFKEYKKGIMQKIFNQEIRFKDENGNDYPEWKEKKLGDILIKNKEKNKENKYNLVQSISNKYGFVNQDEYFEDRRVASKDLKNYYVAQKKLFAYNPSRINVGSLAYKKDNSISVISPLYVSFYTKKEELIDIFLLNWFFSLPFIKQMSCSFEGSVRNNLSYETLSNFIINVPCLEEQKKIADFLSAIDTKIEKISDELENLKEFKKGLLQQMFV